MTELIGRRGLFAGDPTPGSSVLLIASYCAACDRWEFPSRDYCATCNVKPVEAPLSDQAQVEFVTAVLHQPPGALVQAPYAVVLAGFPEGVSVMGVVADLDYEQIAPGDRVRVVAAQTGECIGYQFRLCDN